MAAPAQSPGLMLRRWRNHRGMSQMKLALDADVSARHISFVETGRAKPSREMIVHLCETLEVPLRERNGILRSAGFAALYRETALDDPVMEEMSRAIDLILENQMPGGAIAVDWGWNIVKANPTIMVLMARLVDPQLLADAPPNAMRLVFHPEGLHRFVLNWHEVGPAMLGRIQREAEFEGRADIDGFLSELVGEGAVEQGVVDAAWMSEAEGGPAPLLIPMHIKRDDLELRLFTTVTTLGTPQDITLQELRIETFYPMDDASRKVLEGLLGSMEDE